MMRSDFGSTLLSAAGLLSVAVSASALTPHAAALPSPQSDSWSTFKIVNNLASETEYFGVNVTDEQIWLVLHKGPDPDKDEDKEPGCVTYEDVADPSKQITLEEGDWVQLSQIKDGKIYVSAGTQNGSMYAVIYDSDTPPAEAPDPAPGYAAGECDTTDYAYAAIEWNFSEPPYQNVNVQNIDQFSFINRITVRDTNDDIKGRSGFNGALNSEEILNELNHTYTSSECIYPNVEYYPLTPPDCLEAEPPLPAAECTGLPSNYTSAECNKMGRMSQRIDVQTGLQDVNQPPFRWVGSSKSQMQTIPSRSTSVLQVFGKSFESYLAALFQGSPNQADGYYMDYSGGCPNETYMGYSFYMKVIAGENGYHGLELSQIRTDTLQGDPWLVDKEAGTPLSGTVTILANGESIVGRPLGCPPGDNINQYGLWTDRVIVTGATPDVNVDMNPCEGAFGVGPVITTTIDNYLNDENQCLISSMIATVSTALNFGIIGPEWSPQNTGTGTSYIFQSVTANNHSKWLFSQEDHAYSDVWSAILWKQQDFSLIPNTSDLYSHPTYVSTYSDRLSNLSPGLAPPCLQSAGSTITWDIGVAPPTLPCRADLNFDGHVSGVDLGMLLGSWGGANGDLTDDGIVDGADISELLGSWGACQ